ncbi:MAG: hypothetical protein GX444_09955 [Myxococcales bacterium]|nr:hypothetical protein [Myxococcales bacterium]
MKKLAFILFIALPLAVALLISCGENDDDSGSGTKSDDDNDQTDDDNGSDDDAAGDDDTSAPNPFRLLINGTDGAGLKSWEQTADGWREWEVPPSVGPEPEAVRGFGPILILEGRYGYSAVNYFTGSLKRGFSLYASLGHTWMDFDAEAGWRLDEARPSAGEYVNIMHLQAPGDGSVWTGAQFILTWADNGMGPGPHDYYYSRDDVFRYGEQARKRLSLTDQSILALAVPSPDFGLAWAESIDGTGTLWSYDGANWAIADKPPQMAAGEIDWFWFTDPHHGYAVLSKGFWDNYLLETDGENWETIPAPEGCDVVDPSLVFATGDDAIVIDTTRRTGVFWERRNGEWSCRTADPLPDGGFWEHALVTTDGRAYAVINEGNYEPCLLEITAETITRIELPPELSGLQSVHALGDGAPPVSYSPFQY